MDWNSWRGAPYVYNESWHPTAWVGATASAWLRNYSASPRSQPFVLKVSFHRPHSPYDPPARLLDATPASELPRVHIAGTWDAVYSGGAGAPSGCAPSPDAWCGALTPAADFELGRRAYRASIKFVDEQIGGIVRELEATGLADDTWILWVSDHGDGQGDHYLHRKGFPYELSTNVPGLIVWPPAVAAKLPRGSRSPLLAELRDVLPTMLDIAGAPGNGAPGTNGSSWKCLVTQDPSGASCGGAGGEPWRAWLDLEHSTLFNETVHWNALTDGSVKYIFHAFFASEQLFNLTADPFEMTDLAADPQFAGVLATWRARLAAQFTAEGRGPAWVSADGTLQRRITGTTYGPFFPGPPDAGRAL
jgi:arylsulfatase A-like enzyme